MTTVARFMPVFFRELQRDGQIDRAMAAARGAVRDRPGLVGAGAVHAPAHGSDLVCPRLRAVHGLREVPGPGQRDPQAALHPGARPGPQRPAAGLPRRRSRSAGRRTSTSRWPRMRGTTCRRWRSTCRSTRTATFPRDELGNYLRAALMDDYGEGLPGSTAGAQPRRHPAGASDVPRVADPLPGCRRSLRCPGRAADVALRDHPAMEPARGGAARRGQGPSGRAVPVEAAGERRPLGRSTGDRPRGLGLPAL